MNYWHALPIHYLPTLLQTGRLLCAAQLPRGISPRPTAIVRKRKLGLERFIHLSLQPITPLLLDKHGKGYPHALLRFPESLSKLPGAAFSRWNTKRWTHRDEFQPITDASEKAAFLSAWRAGKFPSAELLVPESLELRHADGFFVPEGWHRPDFTVAPELFPPLAPCPYDAELRAYLALMGQGVELPVPDLPFD